MLKFFDNILTIDIAIPKTNYKVLWLICEMKPFNFLMEIIE